MLLNKIFRNYMKTLIMLLGIVIPMMARAQSTDGFFRGSSENYENRTVEIDITSNTGGGIQNDDFGTPLGSGLLILTAVGAGYAISKRRRNKGFKAINAIKGLNAIMITMVLLLGMTQCKKKTETISNPAAVVEGVHITLDVCGDDGSKVVVTPNWEVGATYAKVDYVSRGNR